MLKAAARRYQQALSNQARCSQIGQAWFGLVLISLVLLIGFSIKNPHAWIFWLPVTIILGPLGLLIWLIAGRRQKVGSWQAALVEAAGHITPIAFTFMLILAVFILFPQAQSSGLFQILFIFVLPVLLGLLLFQGPLLTLAARQGYLCTLARRLPAAWVGANLGVGGITALVLPLVDWASLNCSLLPFSIGPVGTLWAIVIAGACLGILPILLYEGWAVQRGFRTWSALVYGDGELITPSWRELWWWILLSFAVLIGGLFLG